MNPQKENSSLPLNTIKKMMKPELLKPLWQLHTNFQPNLDQAGSYFLNMYSHACEGRNFSSSISTSEDSSLISYDSYFPTMLSTEGQFIFPTENISQHAEGLEAISSTAIDDLLRWWGEGEEMDYISSDNSMENEEASDSSSRRSCEASVAFPSLVLPPKDVEIEPHTGLCHLLKAYGEAIEMEQRELADVLVSCINEKASPVGETMERVAFNLFQSTGSQGDYIKQESRKNFEAAFKAFYEIFPYGRFSHFAANSAIHQEIVSNTGKVHIVDFDMGEGVQWPPMIEAMGKLRRAIKLTSIRMDVQYCSFEETKKRLLDYAKTFGVELEVEEITLGDLVGDIALMNREGEHDSLAFNCMVGLPHMGRTRNRSEVMEFLRVAKQLLQKNKGIITYGDGEDGERMKNCIGYSSFFDEYLKHYQALSESMEENFPDYLTEAKIAMESLFMAPYVSSLSWHQKWEEDKEDSVFRESVGLIGWRLSKESLMEAKEMVNETQSSYKIRVEGQNENEMVLEWRGTPLVRVSAWK